MRSMWVAWMGRWRAFADEVLLHRNASPEQEARFAEHARRQTLRVVRPLLLVACFFGLSWWPFDFVLYAGEPEVLLAFTFWRSSVVGFCLLYYITCDRWEILRRNHVLWGGTLGGLMTFTIAASLGMVGSLDRPWFGSIYLAPIMSFPYLIRLSERIVGVLSVAAGFVGFFCVHPENLAHRDVGTSVGLLLFASSIAVFAGHGTYHLFRVAFVQSEQIEQQRQGLAALSASLTDQVEARTLELRQLVSGIEELRESMRATLARELHDELGQILSSMRIELDVASSVQARGGDTSYLNDKLASLLDATFASVRNILSHLRPRILDDFGLVAAIEWLATDTANRSGLEISVDIRLDSEDEGFLIPSDAATATFRIVQESLTNVLRHAHATRIQIEVQHQHSQLTVRVADDGVGLGEGQKQKSPRSMGLLGMRERAASFGGTLEISSPPAGGTVVKMCLPMPSEDAT